MSAKLYGSAPSLGKSSFAEFVKKEVDDKSQKKPNFAVLAACLFVPWTIFTVIFFVRSFSFHYSSEDLTNLFCYCLLVVPFGLGLVAFQEVKSGGDAKPLILLAGTTMLAWALAFCWSESNYLTNMRPFYDLKQLNTYPSVDPSKFRGAQLMDAGQILFTPGSKLNLQKSIGFKNGDIYCAAPIVAANGSQTVFDFWAIGINCCSGHSPDFHCGEFASPLATKGLRLMDDEKRDMYRLAVQKAQEAFNIKVSHPIFMYWLADPSAELNAWQEDGQSCFFTAIFGFFFAELFVVAAFAVILPKL